jgi:glycosyltransferase involved in cell wall biosynthesis
LSIVISTGCTYRCSAGRACLSSRPCTGAWIYQVCPRWWAAPDAPFVSISNNQRLPLPDANWLGTIYHGLPPGSLHPRMEPGSYLAFLGRLTKEKGPEAAMRIARSAGMPLRIASKVPKRDRGYFKEQLAPLIDGREVELIGEVNDHTKGAFLAGAAALLFPIDWPEPFGLVMIEAMACGTPVIACERGSVPEVIDDGLTGFIIKSEEEPCALSGVSER